MRRVWVPAPHVEEQADHSPDFQPQPAVLVHFCDITGFLSEQSEATMLKHVTFRTCTPEPQSDPHADHGKVRQEHLMASEVSEHDSSASGRKEEQSASPPEDGHVTLRDLVPEPQAWALQALQLPTAH